MPGFSIDDQLAAFLTRGNSIVVATRNAALQPHATRGCGIWVTAPDRVAVLLPRATSSESLTNLRDNGDVAICVSSPFDFDTVQLKGRYLGAADASPDDVLLSERQLRAFGDAAGRFGH